ncbi:hypothetical protein DFJ73DRAFT_793007 [Zopfochytrium polystomum]|nr:hypothetical protein DFJ73DRAFT_793007 [Zopfochytrium polystomum]
MSQSEGPPDSTDPTQAPDPPATEEDGIATVVAAAAATKPVSAQPASPAPPPGQETGDASVAAATVAAAASQIHAAPTLNTPAVDKPLPGKKNAVNLQGLQLDDQDETEEEQFYVNGLFSIENSPAFKALETAKSSGTGNGGKGGGISEARSKELKEKIRSLHQHLLSFHAHEKALQKMTKQLAHDVSGQRTELDRIETKQYSNNLTIGNLKRELLKSENEVRLALEREERLQREIEEGTNQRGELTNDIEEIRKHKADMLEPQLISSIKELKAEIAQRNQQLENLDKDLEEKEGTYDIVRNETEKLDIEREKHSAALARSSEMPAKFLKQSEILRDAISSLVIENVKQTTLSQQFDNELERLARRKKELAEQKLNQSAEYEQHRMINNELEAESDEIFKQHEFAKDTLAAQMAEKVRLEMALKSLTNSIKIEHDVLLRAIRDKESQLKHHRRLETVLNNVSMSTPTIRQQLEESRSSLELLQREDKSQKKAMAALKKEIDLGLFSFLKSEGTETVELEKVAAQKELNRKLEAELEEVLKRRIELGRQIEALKGERELKSRDLIRIQSKYKVITDDKNVKDMAIGEASKRCSESIGRLRDFSALYDVVKNERNKYLNQIQATTQRDAEMKEKIRILSNEIEILRHEIMSKDRELTKKRQDNTAAYAIRDAAKNDANKYLSAYRTRRDEIDQHLSRIATLNVQINAAEADMTSVKARYERSVRERNAVGVHLLDRNDELCVLYERLNVQSVVAARGETALLEREEELRRLRIVEAEVEREVELAKARLPEVGRVLRSVADLEAELEACRASVAELGERMEGSEEAGRCRDLGGADPGQKELVEKIKRIELMLAEKEERLLEKDLILEEVSTLTERLKVQTLADRSTTLQTTNRLNELAKKLKSTTRAIMARVSELSMYQAMAMSLYQEKCEKEAVVEEAKARLVRGEVPTDEMEREFVKMERRRLAKEGQAMAAKEKQERERAPNYVEIDEDNFYSYGNIRTLAEPRPNAYIPSSGGLGELPIPKPYGAHAPFKPQDAGSQMRHFRKPGVRPIEL